MKKTVETCSLLKPKSLVIHVGMKLSSGTVEDDFVFFEEEQKRVGLEKMLDNIARNLKFMGKLANEHGIKLALENLGRFEPFGSLELLPKIVDAIDEPNVGYCIDSGHAHVFGESVSEWIRLAGKKLFETHFHDNHGAWASKNFGKSFVKSTKETDEHLSPGFGTIDWTDTANALNKINFDGPVGFETGGWPDCEESESFKKAISWWRNCEESTVHG
jgi:sugar phosphate isomerase/epimerase